MSIANSIVSPCVKMTIKQLFYLQIILPFHNKFFMGNIIESNIRPTSKYIGKSLRISAHTWIGIRSQNVRNDFELNQIWLHRHYI